MNTQETFRKGLEKIRMMAAAQGGSVSVADILSAFPSVELSAEQIGQIYDYLDREGIKLADYVPHDTKMTRRCSIFIWRIWKQSLR